VETAGVEPAPPRCKRGAHPHGPHPQGESVRTGGVEPPQPEATGLQPAELTRAQRPRGHSETSSRGGRPGSNRYREDHDLECCRYTTATASGDDRSRTGDLSPDKRVLWPLRYAPN
jgi:hypothetical protein